MEAYVANQAWITAAVDDSTALKAIVLSRCLKRALTTRRSAVVVCQPVTPKFRKLLRDEFDQLVNMDGNSEMNGLPLKLHVKIFCWSLPFIRKCVFLDPEMMVVRNCDELFDLTGTVARIDKDGQVNTSVLVLQPNLEVFEKLLQAIKAQKIHASDVREAEDEFGVWLKGTGQLDGELAEAYNLPVNGDDGLLATNEDGVSIVRFVTSHPFACLLQFKVGDSNAESAGILEQALADFWREVYYQDVQPTLNQTPVVANGLRKAKFISCLPSDLPEDFSGDKDPIAIVGMSCRFPGANNVEEYWDVLINGRDCIQKVPDHRWPSEKTEEFREVSAGFLKCPVDEFDGKFFGISPADLINTDPQQRLLMEVVWEALEDAGINPQTLKGSPTGVFVGSWTMDYRDLINSISTKGMDTELSEFHRLYMGNSLGGTGGRLSYLLGLTGPNVATESGCSSGMVGIYLACESLRAGRCKVALTGGVNLLLHPFKKKHMQAIIASDGRCKTFDEKADGFGRGEGVASLVLKKYSDAIKDGDRVLALIRGTGISQEGTSRSFGTPTKECQELAMKSAIDDAGLKPSAVGYVEAHGTGTMVGDPVEMAAITAVYSKGREIPLIVTSGKTNIGHTESCSGFAGIIKVILSMRNNVIAPHINLETINPYIKLDAIPAVIPREEMKWQRVEGKPRIAGVSSFGITGTDVHIILQEPPTYSPPKLSLELERSLHILTLSAKSDSALDKVLETYQEYFSKLKDSTSLADVAHTANTGRAHFAYRVALVGSDFAEISKKLKGSIAAPKKHIQEKKPQICFLFTGQGSQYEGMARSLYETSPTFKMNFDKCERILRESFDIILPPVLWPEAEVQEDSKLKRSLYSQTSIFCVEYSLMKLWESWGIVPDYVLGHSLGEFAAAACAGILSLEDALKLVAERSRLIEGVSPGQILVVNLDKPEVDKELKDFFSVNSNLWLDCAAVNSADQTVLAGPKYTIEKFMEFCSSKNIKTRLLEATNAFHSRDMEPMLGEYRAIASSITFSKPNCIYVSGMTGKMLEDGEMSPEYWVNHTRHRVNFMEASREVLKEGVRVFLEVGPQPVLSALIMTNGSEVQDEIQLLPSLRRKESEWTTLLNSVSKLYVNGFPIDWTRFDQYYSRKKVTLPLYPFNRKVYWYDQGKTVSKGGIRFNAQSLHPLLGYSIPNATFTKIYQNGVCLEKLPYLKDHAIGDKFIFPGAGYLEMCLAAGNASTSVQVKNEKVRMSDNPVAIENLKIEAPLGLEDDHICQMQTTVSTEDSSEMKICIFAQRKKKWIRQSVATFSPLPMTYEPEVSEVWKESLASIRERCSKEEMEMGDFYDKLAAVGLQFGPTFRSLKKIWKCGEKEMLAEIDIPESANSYICHPVVLDALIQSIMVGMEGTIDTLYVPIGIGKFVCFAQKGEGASKYFAHCHWDSDSPDERKSVLYDDTGKVLAFMTGVQMIETSVLQILKALDNQKLSLPNMYEEVWRPKTGPYKTRSKMDTLAPPKIFSKEICEELVSFNVLSEEDKHDRDLRNELVYMYALRAFYDMGWKPSASKVINLAEFITTFGILKGHERFVTRLLVICTEDGSFTREDTTTWTVCKSTPEESEVRQRLREIRTEFGKKANGIPEDVRVMCACGEQLSKILQGKASALPILFPEDKTSDTSAEAFYTNTPLQTKGGNALLRRLLETAFTHHSEAPEEDRGLVRILEVGAGTGSSTKTFISVLEQFNVKYQYTYTDISPAFFIRAQQVFEGYGKKILYKVLNIESDPKSQGFAPGHYDFVMSSNVLHATKDLKQSVNNIRHLLRDDGIMLVIETLAPIRDIDIVFGVLEGFWRYSDLDLRPEHPMLGWDAWTNLVKSCAFRRLNCFPSFENFTGGILAQATLSLPLYKTPEEADKTWLVFGEKSTYDSYLKTRFMQAGVRVIVVSKAQAYNNVDKEHFQLRSDVKEDMEGLFKHIAEAEITIEGILYLWGCDNAEEDPLKLSHSFMFLAQSLLVNFKGLPRLIVVTNGIMPIGDQTAVNVAPGTLWGMVRSFRSEHSGMFVRSIDLDPDEPNLELKYLELFTEMWNDDIDYQVAYRQRSRHVCRFITNKDLVTPLTLPNSERFSLVLPATKNIADLKFTATGKPQLKEKQVEIAVKVTGLNFRDIFVVLKPDKAFDKYNVVGLEYSGVISRLAPDVTKFKIGDRVIGCHFDGDALPNHVVADIGALIPMPSNLTFHEAATLPATFATAFYCLITVAKLTKGETVLIHAGSGGVGLMAIQVAQSVGANIIATAGSRRKRTYIRSLGIEHVFHSRNTDYGEQIKEVMKGPGIHVVLNCLTSPGFKEASLGACTQGARFIEMSKLAVWTTEEVAELRPDVDYTIVDLTVVVPETWDDLWKGLSEFYAKGQLLPIPYICFDAVSIREALIYMQKAKHIGKILVTMPEMDMKTDSEPKTLMFNGQSSYLITGGLGGIGLEVAKWMTESGAEHIILASRRMPNEKATKIINDLIAKGKNIITRSIDVGNYSECKDLIANINSPESGLPPLRGVMHAAGTLADATYPNQTVDTFKTAYWGKVQGAWNLHRLTMDCRLEHFMLFSSIVGLFGPLGLSNYASANTFLDALAHYRNYIGLCAQSINWGQWSEVGAAANINIAAINAFTPSQGIAALEFIMKSHKTQSCVLEVDFSSVRKLTGHGGAYLEELKISKDNQQVSFNIKIERFWEEYNSAPEENKRDVVKCYIEIILRQILKFDDDEPIDENQNFSEMGMDSLMMLEMKNFIQTMLGKNVTMNVSVMAELTTVEKLVNHLMELIVKMESEEEHPLGPADYETFTDELINLINNDMVLPEHIAPTHDKASKRSEVKKVLLTGVTGKFGPYMLEAILSHPVEKVYCLIRSKVNSNIKDRLRQVLKEAKLLDSMDMSRVEVVNGDLSEKMFGLQKPEYTALTASIDSIVHCAIKGNLMEPYTRLGEKKSMSGGSDIRTPNVLGTLNILEFAVEGKTKSILHASTLLCNNKVNLEDNTMSEDWYQPEEVFQLKNVGYPISKFICEVLMEQALDRGIPVQVLRFPALLGDSRSGRFPFPNNHAMIRLLGFCKLGALPAIPLPIQVLPSDVAATLACNGFFRDDTPLGVYNFSNPHLNYFHDFAKVSSEQGFPVEVVEYDIFAKRLSENEEYRTLFPYGEVDMEEGRYVDFSTSSVGIKAWLKNPEGFFTSKKLLDIYPNLFEIIEPPVATVTRDLQYAIDSGIADKFGLKRVVS